MNLGLLNEVLKDELFIKNEKIIRVENSTNGDYTDNTVNYETDVSSTIVDNDYQEYYFRVIGVDRKIHISDLQNNKCKCGVEILRKYVTEKDYSDFFSCYECTF